MFVITSDEATDGRTASAIVRPVRSKMASAACCTADGSYECTSSRPNSRSMYCVAGRTSVASSEVITNIDPYQAQLINKMRRGSLLVPGQTLLVIEVEPAAYVTVAANEAEKAADIQQIYVSNVGRYGRLYQAGSESEILAARDAAIAAIEGLAVSLR